MRKLLMPLLLGYVMLSPLALAQTKDEHASHHPEKQAGQADVAPPTSPESLPAPSDADPVRQGMAHLQSLMQRIESSTDANERENLLHEHMLAMLEEAKLLRTQTNGMKMAMM